MNPLAALFISACAWIAIFGVNRWWFSLTLVLVAWLLARKWSVVAGTTALALPIFGSLLIIHGLFGNVEAALELGLRATALMATLLAATSSFSVPQLAKALQGTALPAQFTYAICGAIRILPQGQHYASIYAEQARHLGRKGRFRYVAFPLVTRLLVQGSDRAYGASAQGIALRGPKTVARPVSLSKLDICACVLVLVGTVISCVVA